MDVINGDGNPHRHNSFKINTSRVVQSQNISKCVQCTFLKVLHFYVSGACLSAGEKNLRTEKEI